MLRANLLPGVKKEKKFKLGTQDKVLIGIVAVFLIVLGGIYGYAIFEKNTASNNLNEIVREISTYSKEKAIYEENKTLAQKTYDLEKYLSTATSAQFNKNLILDNISQYMLKSTTMPKITLNLSNYYIVMDFSSKDFANLTKLFNNLLTDNKLKDVKILSYSVPFKTTSQILDSAQADDTQATMEIAATWVVEENKTGE